MITRLEYEDALRIISKYEEEQEQMNSNPYLGLPIAEIIMKYYLDEGIEPKVGICTRIKHSLEQHGIFTPAELIQRLNSCPRKASIKSRIQYSFRNVGDLSIDILIRSMRNIGFDLETFID